MNAAYVHLSLNNFPPVVSLVAVLMLMVGMGIKNVTVVRVAFVLMVVAALFTIPTFLSGEPAEELVEKLDGVNAVAIHPHEEAGKWALIALSIVGVAALAALIAFRSRDLPRWAAIGMLVLSLWATSVVFRTAYLGGKIHHPETEMGP